MNKDTAFYLGTKEKNDAEPISDQPVFHLSYAGALSYSFEHHEHRPRTNEELEKAHTLSLKQDRKSRIVWRLLYIEKRRQDLLDYMSLYEKKHSGEALKVLLLCVVIIINLSICLFILIPPLPAILLTAVLLGLGFVLYAKYNAPDRWHSRGRMAYWNNELFELQSEHDELEIEKEQISEEIRELEELLS